MRSDLKEKVENLVNDYKEGVKKTLKSIRDLEKSELYSSDGKAQMIRDIKATLQKADDEYNNAISDLIQTYKNSIQNSTINKPSDYQNLLSNALNQINMIGDKLTDKVAYEIVRPFFGDFKTMHDLHSVISTRYGKDGLGLTTVTLGWLDSMIYRLDNLKTGVRNFFNAGLNLTVGLDFLVREDMVISECEVLDSMAQKMDSLINMKFEEAETSISESVIIEEV